MRLFLCAYFAAALALQAPRAVAQNPEPDHNPERRGIRLLDDEHIRKLSTPRKHGKAIPIDERKSIFVTDVEILKLFTFDELMDRLVEDSGSHTLTRDLLFQQWWDTANPKATFNLPFGGPNCDSGLLNTFPYACPRDEGQQVTENPFGGVVPTAYTAIALSNRFDLATPPEKGGTDCGEYRIVFERNTGATNPLDRNLIIFEAVLPNPRPHAHSLGGCRPVQEFWEELSAPGLSLATRAKRLHEFYYKGLPREHVQAVVHAKHYGAATAQAEGQVRTNQFMAQAAGGAAQHGPWLLRQFHVETSAGVMKFVPVAVANNPLGTLFDETISQPLGAGFRAAFLTQIASLSNPNIDLVAMSTTGQYDAGESQESGTTPMDYKTAFANSPNFRAAIQAKIPAGSGLTPDDIVNRAQTQTCAGCHHLSVNVNIGGGLTWPATISPGFFTHEQLASPQNGQYQISDALKNVFLPFRKHVIETFLGP